MVGNLTLPSEQPWLWAELPAPGKASAHCVARALSFSSHICHYPALHVTSHIPDSWHRPQKCALSRIDVPCLWTQPSLLYVLPGTGVKPGSCWESRSRRLPGPLSQQGRSGVRRKHGAGNRLANYYWERIWLILFTWFSQCSLSLPMFLNDKPIKWYPAEYLVCNRYYLSVYLSVYLSIYLSIILGIYKIYGVYIL